MNTLFLAYAGASLPLLVLFVSGGEALGTVATTEVMAVEVVRALCGSVGLIAAVPLTTLLAASLALEKPAAGQEAPAPAGTGRAPYSPARGMDPGDAAALFGRVLDLHGPALSSAVVGVVPGDSVDIALPVVMPDDDDEEPLVEDEIFEMEPEPELEREPEPEPQAGAEDGDVLEGTPEFLEETPEHDRLWFEQRPPRDFNFDD